MPRAKKSEKPKPTPTPKPTNNGRSNQPRKAAKRGSYKKGESRAFLPLSAGEGKNRSNQPRTTKEKIAMEDGYRMKWRKIKDVSTLNRKSK